MSKKMILYLIFPVLGLIIFYSCFSDIGSNQKYLDPIDNDDEECKEIIIDETKYKTAQVDDYEIKYAYIKDDTLIAIIHYGGGCGSTSLKLITNGIFMESNPVQLDIILSFVDADPCEALIQRQICFDISKLAVLFNDSYQTDEGTIIVRLKDYDDKLGYDF